MPSTACTGDLTGQLFVIKQTKPVLRLDRDSDSKATMGPTSSCLGCKASDASQRQNVNVMPAGRSTPRRHWQVPRARVWPGCFSHCASAKEKTREGEVLDGLQPALSWHWMLQLYWSIRPLSKMRVQEKYFFPLSPSSIYPQHLSLHRRGWRQLSRNYAKQLAETIAVFWL